MNYLYHGVPKNIEGNVLYPLNTLKQLFPELYQKEVEKYKGREFIMQQKIPTLDCLWNDVLHFTAVHPSSIKKALFEAGRKNNLEIKFYEIDPKILDPKKTIIYLYKYKNSSEKMREDNFESYDPDKIPLFSSFPEETKEYYKAEILAGKKPLLFHKIPHILFKGSLPIENIKILKV
jgi:hypothetical protein